MADRVGLIFASLNRTSAHKLKAYRRTPVRLELVVKPTPPWVQISLFFLKTKKPALQRAFNWRTEWDSNPRYPLGVHTISNRAPSASRSSVQLAILYIYFHYFASIIFLLYFRITNYLIYNNKLISIKP